MHPHRRAVMLMLATACAATALAVPAQAASKPAPVPASRTADKAGPARAAGFILKTRGATPSDAVLTRTKQLLHGKASVDRVVRGAQGTSSILLDDFIDSSTAVQVAHSLGLRSDVEWAVPNYLRTRADAPPVTPNDTYFSQQRSLWDSRASSDSTVTPKLGSNNFPVGGFSVKAPDIWQKTTGSSSTVVAVVDTGITTHPDLTGQTVTGYDMISANAVAGQPPNFTSNDGNGRDADPADPGDWTTAGQCGTGSDASDSSWHGTHVAGIIAAKQGNAAGVTGIAPGVKIEPVRVLGRCGGLDSDVIDGILWAAGASVPGAPVNTNPAQVINLSLSGESPCTQPYIDAINTAHQNGAAVVVAAGNDGVDASGYAPGNCLGAITVAATDEYGFRASYSNYGAPVDLAAPGGEFNWGLTIADGVLSTVNQGTTVPTAAGYSAYEGTSMAAPAVSAALALLSSLGATEGELESATTTPDFVESPTTTYNPNAGTQLLCGTSCGKGILDFSSWPIPISAPTIVGQPVVGQSLHASATWLKTPATLRQQWTSNNLVVADQTTPYVVQPSDFDNPLTVDVWGRETGLNSGFPDIYAGQATSSTVMAGSTVALTVSGAAPVYAQPFNLKVTVASPPTVADGTVSIMDGATVLRTGSLTSGAATFAFAANELSVGPHILTATYDGTTKIVQGTSPLTTIRVAKATSAISHYFLDSTITKSTYPKSRVTIKVAGVPKPTGLVKVFDGTKWLKTYSMYASFNGVHTYTLPRITKTGKHSIKWIYYGNSNISGKTSAIRTLTVR